MNMSMQPSAGRTLRLTSRKCFLCEIECLSCVHAVTAVFARYKLYHLLYYFKTYPVHRHLQVVTQSRGIRHYNSIFWRRVAFLSDRMSSLAEESWSQRNAAPNPVQHLFPGNFGIVDTFPIRGKLLLFFVGCDHDYLSSAPAVFVHVAIVSVQRQILCARCQNSGSCHFLAAPIVTARSITGRLQLPRRACVCVRATHRRPIRPATVARRWADYGARRERARRQGLLQSRCRRRHRPVQTA